MKILWHTAKIDAIGGSAFVSEPALMADYPRRRARYAASFGFVPTHLEALPTLGTILNGGALNGNLAALPLHRSVAGTPKPFI